MKTYAFRLHKGQDLLKSIQEFADTHQISAAVILSAVGCVSQANIRDAGGVATHGFHERMEIVSLMGTVSKSRTHLHIALSREDLTTLGGHLMDGCIVNTTAEIVLLVLEGFTFSKAFDPDTGYHELVISRLNEEK